jgi:hypothetical protein
LRCIRGFLFLLLCIYFPRVCFSYTIDAWQFNSSPRDKPQLNLVFVPLYYPESEIFLKDINGLVKKISAVVPFNEFVDSIAFWKINLSAQEQDLLFKETEAEPYIAVDKNFTENIPQYLGQACKLIIIDYRHSYSRAQFSAFNETSIVLLGRRRYREESDFRKGFLHELGHSLGLQNECIRCQESDPGPPNCAPSKQVAQQWWGDLIETKTPKVRYVNGCCGKKEYIRPTIASLMNDTSRASTYGPVNERYLRQKAKELFAE